MPKPKLIIEPSYWLENGIQLDATAGLPLFKFTEHLQMRSNELLLRSKSQSLSNEEQTELDSLTELSQIFTYANSLLAENALWFPQRSENSLPKEPHPAASIATPLIV